MISKKSAREILNQNEIRNKLKDCFKKCALGRIQLRKCVVKAMNAGLTKKNILSIIDEMTKKIKLDEASLCAIIAIGQALRYTEKTNSQKSILKEDKKDIEINFRSCFKKCILAKKQLRKCIVNALNEGLTKDELLAISDDIVGGFGKNEVSLCAIIAVDQVLEYEESARARPLDILKERSIEREDT